MEFLIGHTRYPMCQKTILTYSMDIVKCRHGIKKFGREKKSKIKAARMSRFDY